MQRVPRLSFFVARPAWAWPLVALVAVLGIGSATAVTYENVAATLGIDFQQAGEIHDQDEFVNDLTGFPEIFGPGACWADFDGDGLDDLFIASQQYNPLNPGTDGWRDRFDPHNRLYLNGGDGSLTDVTARAGVASRRFAYGCSAADYDGDADVDLFVSNFGDERWGGNQLYRNDGGARFTDVSLAAGVDSLGACGDHACLSTNSAWGDYDNDGDLDLYVSNYADSDLEDTNHGPANHVAQPNFLYRNNGDGTFTEVAEEAGVQGDVVDEGGSKSFGAIWFDHDLDGDLDLFVANDQEPDDFYVNNGDGTFDDRSDESGLADPRAGMGVAIADYDGDAFPDIFITHYQFQDFGFYRNRQDGTFEDRSGEDELAHLSEDVGWGTGFVDVERDGDLDLIAVHGHTVFPFDNYNAPVKVFRNDPEAEPETPWDRHWLDISDDVGEGARERSVARGAAFADYDLDGDTDIFVGNNANQTTRLLLASGSDGHFLNVRLREDGMNRYGIGAKVKLEAPGLAAQYREVQAGSSYLSQNSLTLEFGLGDASEADRITVTWPDGGTTIVEDVAADQTVRIDRATGAVVTDVLAPVTELVVLAEEPGTLWLHDDFDALLAADDRGAPSASGVTGTELAVDDGPFAPYNGDLLSFTEEGRHELRFRSEDAAGNVEPERTVALGIDVTPPVARHAVAGTPGNNGWFVGDEAVVTLEADDAVSGVEQLLFRIDDGPWTVYDGPLTFEDEARRTIEYHATDRAGNAGEIVTFDLMLDATPPEAAITSPVGGALHVLGNAPLQLLGSEDPSIIVATGAKDLGEDSFPVASRAEDAVSGVRTVVFLLDGDVAYVDHEGPGWSWDWNTTGVAPGAHQLEVIAIDTAGNLETAERTVIVVSISTPPSPPPVVRSAAPPPDGPAPVADLARPGREARP